MTAIGRGDGEALLSYLLETTFDVEVGWDEVGGTVKWKYRRN